MYEATATWPIRFQVSFHSCHTSLVTSFASANDYDVNFSSHIWIDNLAFCSRPWTSWFTSFDFLWLVTCFRLWVSECLQEISAWGQCNAREKENRKNVARTHLLCSKAATTLPYLLHTCAMCHCEAAPGTFRGLGCVCAFVSLSVFSICTALNRVRMRARVVKRVSVCV